MLKYSFFILILTSFAFQISFAQRDSLSITFNPYFSNYQYHKNGLRVSSDDFYSSLHKNVKLTEKFNEGKNTHLFGNVAANIGAFLIGWNIGQLVVNKNEKKNYTLGLIGVGALTVGLPVSWMGRNKSQKALVEFNQSVQTLIIENKPKNANQINEKKFHNLAITESPKEKLDSACVIVRIPVNGNKINLLNKKLKDENITASYKSKLKKELDMTITENNEYLSLIQRSFDIHFHVKNIYFLPDSSFKSHLAGNQTGFLNDAGVLDKSLQCSSQENFYFITGKDKEQLLFVDKFLARPSTPLPHKKNIFFPSFKKLFNRTNYIHKQIIYFNEKLSKL